jgi:hypothetical protein
MTDNAQEYTKLIESVIRRAGLEPGECYNEEQQCWQFAKGSADIFITLVDIAGEYYVNIAAPIMAVPGRRREEFFERLLEENGQRIAVKFSLRDDVVWLEINREIKGLSFDETMRSLVRVAEVADELDQILVNEYGDDWDG